MLDFPFGENRSQGYQIPGFLPVNMTSFNPGFDNLNEINLFINKTQEMLNNMMQQELHKPLLMGPPETQPIMPIKTYSNGYPAMPPNPMQQNLVPKWGHNRHGNSVGEMLQSMNPFLTKNMNLDKCNPSNCSGCCFHNSCVSVDKCNSIFLKSIIGLVVALGVGLFGIFACTGLLCCCLFRRMRGRKRWMKRVEEKKKIEESAKANVSEVPDKKDEDINSMRPEYYPQMPREIMNQQQFMPVSNSSAQPLYPTFNEPKRFAYQCPSNSELRRPLMQQIRSDFNQIPRVRAFDE